MPRQKFLVFWSPEGRQIAEVQARNPHQAIRLAPKPYRLYPGECYALTPAERELQLEGERIREGIAVNSTQQQQPVA